MTTSDEPAWWPLRDALNLAQSILDDEIGPIEGCNALSRYAYDLFSEWHSEKTRIEMRFGRRARTSLRASEQARGSSHFIGR